MSVIPKIRKESSGGIEFKLRYAEPCLYFGFPAPYGSGLQTAPRRRRPSGLFVPRNSTLHDAILSIRRLDFIGRSASADVCHVSSCIVRHRKSATRPFLFCQILSSAVPYDKHRPMARAGLGSDRAVPALGRPRCGSARCGAALFSHFEFRPFPLFTSGR